jgi:cephalosporin hydroxylase
MNTLNNIEWYPDRMLYNGYVFRLQHYFSDNWDGGDTYFLFYKIRELVDQYELFFNRIGNVGTSNVFELGVFGGGSIPFWNELLQPEKHIGIDLQDIIVTDYLKSYIKNKRESGKLIEIYGEVDQADKRQMRRLANEIFQGPLDLVIDDASHLYHQTKASFESLFPLLRSGGLYIIEDWAWGHWDDFFASDHFWVDEVPPTRLIHELTEMAGTDASIIRSIQVYRGFVVVERGESTNLDDSFTLERYIKRRPEKGVETTVYRDFTNLVKKILNNNIKKI